MNPMQILLILKARYKIALLVFLISLMVGAAAYKQLPRRYESTATVVFNVKPQTDPVLSMISPLMPGYLATQKEIISSDRVSKRIVKLLRLDESPAIKRQWLASTGGNDNIVDWAGGYLKRGLQVTPSRSGSHILSITYSAGDPNFSATVANAYAEAYIDATIELRVDPARQNNRWFGEQAKSLRENLEKSQRKLSAFQKRKGLIAPSEAVDDETRKLGALVQQLTSIQAQTTTITSKQRSENMETLPDVMGSGLVSSLTSQIAGKEATLVEVALNLGENHPQYQRMKSEIAALKTQLTVARRQVTASFATSRTASRSQEAQIRRAIAAQKQKLLALKDDRDELEVLQREVQAAQSTYTTVINRFNQTSLESQITHTNVSMLNTAIAPIKPASPNRNKIVAMAIIFGLLGGGGAAFLLELIDRRVRSVADLSEMLQLPVLAVIKPPHRRLLGFGRRNLLVAPR